MITQCLTYVKLKVKVEYECDLTVREIRLNRYSRLFLTYKEGFLRYLEPGGLTHKFFKIGVSNFDLGPLFKFFSTIFSGGG